MTVRVGTLFRVPVRVHFALPAAFLVFAVLTPRYTEPAVFLGITVFVVAMLASLLARELVRAAVARRRRLEVRGFTLWPLGAVMDRDEPRDARAGIGIALSGLVTSLLLALLAGAGIALRDGVAPGVPRFGAEADPLAAAWNVNASLALLNLIPGLPFDAGAAVEAMIRSRRGRRRARQPLLLAGGIAGFVLVYAGVGSGSILLAAVGGWAMYEVIRLHRALEGEMEDGELLLGVYDFSRGHTSLEENAPDLVAEPRPAPAPVSEKRRAAADAAAADSARARLDDLLDRIATAGIGSLSDEEKAFLNEESRRLRAQRPGKSPTGR